MSSLLPTPTSLYIHMPWCIQKCPYCDFNSHKSPAIIPEEAYINALIADLQQDLINYPTTKLHSIFIGGGTPSLFSAKNYARLFEVINREFNCSSSLEITLEANPGTVEQERFREYRDLGINRLSLGIQSFNPKHLKKLGRIHNDAQAYRAIETAQRFFTNINLDIMHGLPEQTPEEGLNDLQTALSYAPSHLSWYQLTIEPNTVFYKENPPLPSEDDAGLLEDAGLALLKSHGYLRYEISAFCKPSTKISQHNLNYWTFGDYYGIGAGAHGKHTLANKTIERTRKYRQPKDYLNPNKPFLAEKTSLTDNDKIFEFMLNATRLEQPIAYNLFTERTGLPLIKLQPALLAAKNKGLLIYNETHWQITAFGRRFTNDLHALFLPNT